MAYFGQQGKIGSRVKKPRDYTAQVYRAYHTEVVRFTQRAALEAKRALENQFVRRSPKKDIRDLFYFSSTAGPGASIALQKRMTVAEFARMLKRKIAKQDKRATKTGDGGTLYVATHGPRKRKTLSGVLSSRKRDKNKGRKGTAAWVDTSLKKTSTDLIKIGAPAGSPPYTWTNPKKKKGQTGFPNYYLRKMIFTERISDNQIVVYISPYFKGNKILEILEKGGTKPTHSKKLIGYRREIYRLAGGRRRAGGNGFAVAPGTRYGKVRQRILPVYDEKRSTARIAARPFLGGAEHVLRDKMASLWKR